MQFTSLQVISITLAKGKRSAEARKNMQIAQIKRRIKELEEKNGTK